MSAVPDPAELAPTRDPAAYAARPLMSRGFWVMIAFCVVCLAGSVLVATLLPRLYPSHPASATKTAIPAATNPAAFAPPASTPSTAAPVLAQADVTALSARVTRLEGDQGRIANAAAAALAAAALSDAAAQPRPFVNDLAVFARLLPGSPDALALAPLAETGAPTRAALATQLADLASQVSVASHAPGKGASFMDQAVYAVSRVVSIRRVSDGGTGPDAILVAAQHHAAEGDLEGAVAALDTLPAPARSALTAWRAAALRRIEIDQHIAGLRAQAVADLATARMAAS
jgi:hypothetical protein